MSQRDKALMRLQQKPVDFTWDEAVSLMRGCGFTLLKSGGSRRKFYHEESGVLVSLHEPHPNKVLKPYMIDELVEALRSRGYIQ